MKLRKKSPLYFALIILLVVGLLFTVNHLMRKRDSEHFVTACKELQGKALTVDNVKSVSNHIYFHAESPNNIGGLEAVQQYHLNQYLAYLRKSETAQDEQHKVSIKDNMITLSEGWLDGTWRCTIQGNDKGIVVHTGSYYQPE